MATKDKRRNDDEDKELDHLFILTPSTVSFFFFFVFLIQARLARGSVDGAVVDELDDWC